VRKASNPDTTRVLGMRMLVRRTSGEIEVFRIEPIEVGIPSHRDAALLMDHGFLDRRGQADAEKAAGDDDVVLRGIQAIPPGFLDFAEPRALGNRGLKRCDQAF
jgi:hypothetical protein